MAVLSVGLVFVAFAASSSGNAAGAGILGAAAFGGFSLAALLGGGYQTIQRRSIREAPAYRGPSPFLVFAAVFAAANAVALVLRLSGLTASLSQAGVVLLSVGIVVPLYAALVWLLVVREGALSWSAMGWPSFWDRSPRTAVHFTYGVGLAVPIVLVTLAVGLVVSSVLHVSEPSLLPVPSTPTDWVIDLLVAVVLAPVGEELFFRGFAQTAWTQDLGWRAGLLRAALFFAIIHALNVTGADFSDGARLAISAALVRLPVALALGWVFARSGSIAAPIGLHAAFNVVSLLLFAFISAGASPG